MFPNEASSISVASRVNRPQPRLRALVRMKVYEMLSRGCLMKSNRWLIVRWAGTLGEGALPRSSSVTCVSFVVAHTEVLRSAHSDSDPPLTYGPPAPHAQGAAVLRAGCCTASRALGLARGGAAAVPCASDVIGWAPHPENHEFVRCRYASGLVVVLRYVYGLGGV